MFPDKQWLLGGLTKLIRKIDNTIAQSAVAHALRVLLIKSTTLTSFHQICGHPTAPI